MKTPLNFTGKIGKTDQALEDLGVVRNFKAGERIVSETMKARSIPVVLDGSVKVLRVDEEQNELVLYYLESGEACIMSFLAGLNNKANKVKAIAQEPCKILFIPVNEMRRLIRDNPEWLNYLFQIYHKRFEELLEMIEVIAFKKMDERLLDFLQKRSEVVGSNSLRLTHEQLAQELGTAREVVSRLLKTMEEKKLVKLSRNKITLL